MPSGILAVSFLSDPGHFSIASDAGSFLPWSWDGGHSCQLIQRSPDTEKEECVWLSWFFFFCLRETLEKLLEDFPQIYQLQICMTSSCLNQGVEIKCAGFGLIIHPLGAEGRASVTMEGMVEWTSQAADSKEKQSSCGGGNYRVAIPRISQIVFCWAFFEVQGKRSSLVNKHEKGALL